MQADANKRDDEIRRLLQQAEQDKLSDDFDREAAEGLRAMGGEEEARRLMASLDRRTGSLFSSGKKNVLIYWSMAAALCLVIGFTVFFLRGTNTLESSKQLSQASHAETNANISQGPIAAPAMAEAAPATPKNIEKPKGEEKPERSRISTGSDNKTQPASFTGAPVEDAIATAKPAAFPPESEPTLNSQKSDPAFTAAPEEKAARESDTDPGSEKSVRKHKKTMADQSPVAAGAARQADEEAGTSGQAPGVQTLAGCLQQQLHVRLPEWFSKEFTATASVVNGKVTKVNFPQRSGLTKKEEAAADSVLKLLDPQCPGIPAAEADVQINHRP